MSKARKTAFLALAVVLAACSENAVAPRSEAPVQSTTVEGGGSTAALTSWDTLRFSITIDPSRQTYYYLGAGNSINFPAHSLCDPTKSTYGDSEWDKPCTAQVNPLTIQVKGWIDNHGHPRLDFSPNVRFVPTANPAGWVVLTLGDYFAALNPLLNVNYCRTVQQAACLDESKVDPTLLTIHDPVTGKLTRRIKHFSGYNVAAGDDSKTDGSWDRLGSNSVKNVNASTQSLAVLDKPRRSEVNMLLNRFAFVRRFSGYMLASG